MTISKLATGTVWSPNCSSRNGKHICKFTPHYMAGNLSAAACGQVFVPASRQASSNYGIGSDGTIYCYVDEETRAWTSSSESNDSQAITVEVANISNATGEITDAAWQALIKLATDVCHRYNFKLNWNGTASGSLTAHYLFSNTSCPGPWLKAHMNDLAKAVNDNLAKGNVSFSGTKAVRSPYTDGSAASVTGGSNGDETGTFFGVIDHATAYAIAVNSQVIFGREDTYPFAISTDQNTSLLLDYDKIREKDVVAQFIDCGTLFDTNHNTLANYEQPKFEDQIKEAEEANMVYGLMATTRARNEAEAQKEIDRLQILAKRHPPKLGFWLNLDLLDKQEKINNKIIELYAKNLDEWGFKAQKGFRAKKEMLDRITWKDFQDDWYWWMVRHVKDVSNFEEEYVPTPKFFAYEDPEDELMKPDFETAASGNFSMDASGGGDLLGNGTVGKGTTVEVPSSVPQTGIIGDYTGWVRSDWVEPVKSVYNRWIAQGRKWNNKIAVVDNRYLVAVRPKFGKVGDALDIKLEDGTVINAVMGDTKGSDAGSEWGHYFGSKISLVEFEADPPFRTNEHVPKQWLNKKVKSITNCGSIMG